MDKLVGRDKRLGYPHPAVRRLGLSPVTLTNYTRVGYTDLVRRIDYVVRCWRQGPYIRRNLYFTERGLASKQGLTTFSAKNIGWHPHSAPSSSAWTRFATSGRMAVRWKVTRFFSVDGYREGVALVAREYLRGPGCAVPNCSCLTHRLGLFQTDEK
jgi:hypothetical protein